MEWNVGVKHVLLHCNSTLPFALDYAVRACAARIPHSVSRTCCSFLLTLPLHSNPSLPHSSLFRASPSCLIRVHPLPLLPVVPLLTPPLL